MYARVWISQSSDLADNQSVGTATVKRGPPATTAAEVSGRGVFDQVKMHVRVRQSYIH